MTDTTSRNESTRRSLISNSRSPGARMYGSESSLSPTNLKIGTEPVIAFEVGISLGSKQRIPSSGNVPTYHSTTIA